MWTSSTFCSRMGSFRALCIGEFRTPKLLVNGSSYIPNVMEVSGAQNYKYSTIPNWFCSGMSIYRLNTEGGRCPFILHAVGSCYRDVFGDAVYTFGSANYRYSDDSSSKYLRAMVTNQHIHEIAQMSLIKHPNVPNVIGILQSTAFFDRLDCLVERFLLSKLHRDALCLYYERNGIKDMDATLVSPLGRCLVRQLFFSLLGYNSHGLHLTNFKERCWINFEELVDLHGVRTVSSLAVKIFRMDQSSDEASLNKSDAVNLSEYISETILEKMGLNTLEFRKLLPTLSGTGKLFQQTEFQSMMKGAFFIDVHRRHTIFCQLYEHLEGMKLLIPHRHQGQVLMDTYITAYLWLPKINPGIVNHLWNPSQYVADSPFYFLRCTRMACQHREDINDKATKNGDPLWLGDSTVNALLYFHRCCPDFFALVLDFIQNMNIQINI